MKANRVIAVHVKTQSEWDYVIGHVRTPEKYYKVGGDISVQCIEATDGCHSEVDYFEDRPDEYHVLSLAEWIRLGRPKRTNDVIGDMTDLFDVKRI